MHSPQERQMIFMRDAQQPSADAVIAIVEASIQEVAGFAGTDASSLEAMQRQTDAAMIRDVAQCLAAAGDVILANRVEHGTVRSFIGRLPRYDRTTGQFRMLVELTVIPERLANAVWRIAELDAAIAVRSGDRRFRLKELPVEQYVRLGRTLLNAFPSPVESEALVSDEDLELRGKRSAAAFIWMLALNVLSELRRIAEKTPSRVRFTSDVAERMMSAARAPEKEWSTLREWLGGRARADAARDVGVPCPPDAYPLDAFERRARGESRMPAPARPETEGGRV